MIDATEHLSSDARLAIEDPRNAIALHQATTWEIQIKYLSGKLKLSRDPKSLIKDAISQLDLDYKTLENDDIWLLKKLPNHHKDPFDRILIAHALSAGLKLVTPDPEIHKYPIPVIW
jgi:PIN domain nuclease of toxin-antitoxin system